MELVSAPESRDPSRDQYQPVPSTDYDDDQSQQFPSNRRISALTGNRVSTVMMGKTLTGAVHQTLGGRGHTEWFIAASEAKDIEEAEEGGCAFMMWVLLHFLAMCVYLMRAVDFYLNNPGRLWPEVPSLCFAGTHFAVGIMMPMWSHRNSRSKEVVCIMAHRTQFAHLKSKGFRQCMSVHIWAAKYLGPVSNLLSLVGAVHASLCLWHPNYCFDRYLLGIFICSCTGMAGMLVFSSGKCGDMVVDACTIAVNGLIDEMQNRHSSSDWDFTSKHFFYLAVALSNVWEWYRVGGLFLCRIVVLFLASFAFGVYSLFEHDLLWRNILILVGVLVGLCGLGLILQLAAITSLCQNRRPGAHSVAALAQRYLLCDEGGHNDEDDELCESVGKKRVSAAVNSIHDLSLNIKSKHQLAQMAVNQAGVRISGILFTYSLVLSAARTMVVYLPLILGVVGNMLHPMHHSMEQVWEDST